MARVTKKEAAAMAEEMRKIEDVPCRKSAVQAAAHAYKKRDPKFTITSFAIDCGLPYSVAVEIRSM